MYEAWAYEELGEICKVTSGGTPKRDQDKYWGGSIPWVTTAEIKGGVISGSQECITEEGVKGSSAKLFPLNTVLIAMYGQGKTRGMAGILGIEATTNQACAAILPSERLNPHFLFQYLSSKYEHLRSLSNLGGQQNLSGGIIKSLVIPVPDLEEQERIVQILSTWDRSIEATEKLLENSKKRKKALMQQLLTGKKRLPGFSGEWARGELGDLAIFKGGTGFPESMQGLSSGDVPFIKVSDMNTVGNEVTMVSSNNWLSNTQLGKFSRSIMPETSIVFAKVGAALLLNRVRLLSMPTLIDNNLMAAIPKDKRWYKFLHQYISTIDFGSLVQEGALPSINQSQVSKVKVSYPTELDEANRICEILESCDHEIFLNSKILDSIKTEKKALMQQLLTGKKRVKVEAEVA